MVAMTTMNAEIKAQWLSALRSDRYQQGTRALAYGFESVKHCCLGVLCDIAAEQGVVDRERVGTGGSYAYAGRDDVLPREVIEWSGLPDDNPVVSTATLEDERWTAWESLAELNDGGLTFDEIAGLIETHIEGVP